MRSTTTLCAVDVILGVNYFLILSIALLVLSGCTTVNGASVTCTVSDRGINCGVVPTSSQDLRAYQEVAKDEKPDRPFKESFQRFEKTSS